MFFMVRETLGLEVKNTHRARFIIRRLMEAQLSVSKFIVERRWEGEEHWEYKWKEGSD